MAVSANKIHLSGLARKLVIDGLLDEKGCFLPTATSRRPRAKNSPSSLSWLKTKSSPAAPLPWLLRRNSGSRFLTLMPWTWTRKSSNSSRKISSESITPCPYSSAENASISPYLIPPICKLWTKSNLPPAPTRKPSWWKKTNCPSK